MSHLPQSYTPVAPYETPRRARRTFRVPPGFLLLIPLVLFAFLFFGVSYLVTPEPDVEVHPEVGAVSLDGREVLLVPYDRHGARGMFQLMAKDMFQVRVAAADAVTGEVLWDKQLSDELIWEADVLAAGTRYAYLATDDGLIVLDLRDGSIVARGDGVAGLGGSFVAKPAAYGYDPEGRRVLAMNADGAVLEIPLDSTTATPVDEATTAKWAKSLSVTRSKSTPSATATKAELSPGARVELRERPSGSLLVLVGENGQETPLGTTVFHGAHVVVNGKAAAGASSGYVLVEHSRSVNDKEDVLSAISLDSGAVVGSLTTDSAPERAVTLPSGATVVATHGQVVVVAADGKITALPVGSTDFFGSPS
ncbi:PA2928 family protein [Actinokineospora sp. NBRC 105648]|uniref:PA2928 family protein n=1 Tax=Actinokineospora sp. NBRC 105648 TaxID=3032206 RepID=UPI0024A32DBD|nr:PA2928 family protein [Actinokineospora sp. NBRC 105648]GLZ37800.1 hypothetical protein Acsp05_14250 [Actinokineospora sp. NBRC 105648]